MPTLANNGFNEVENVDDEIDDDYLHEYDMLSDSDEDVEDHKLPKDPRTLLKTAKNYAVTEICGGSYHHSGIATCISEELLSATSPLSVYDIDAVALQINIDGLPLFKSSSTQFWPILGRIVQPFVSKRFIIGLYLGTKKPGSVHDYLNEFGNEMSAIQEFGLHIGEIDHRLHVKISCIICDTPARAYVKQVKGHTTYYGCDKCCQKGLWKGKMTFPRTDAPTRTDAQFDEMVNEEHHLGPPPLTNLSLGMVSGIYGDDQYVYNVHGLVHLAADVGKFGALDNYSAFVFESFLGRLKRLIRKPNFPLQQVVRRLSEKRDRCLPNDMKIKTTCGIPKKQHAQGPVNESFKNISQYKELFLSDFYLSVNRGDNCILVVMYLVVEYTDNNELAIIPENWLDGRSCALWPPYKSSLRINSTVCKNERPNETWKSFPIRELYRSDSYEKARKKLKLAEDQSDLQTAVSSEEEQVGIGRFSKRKRRSPERFNSDSESSVEAVQRRKTLKKSVPEGRVTKYLESLPKSPPHLPILKEKTEVAASKSPPAVVSKDASASHARDVRLFTILEKIYTEQRELKRLINSVLVQVQRPEVEECTALEEGINFPLFTREQLGELEGKLCDEKVFASVNVFSAINMQKMRCRESDQRMVAHGQRSGRRAESKEGNKILLSPSLMAETVDQSLEESMDGFPELAETHLESLPYISTKQSGKKLSEINVSELIVPVEEMEEEEEVHKDVDMLDEELTEMETSSSSVSCQQPNIKDDRKTAVSRKRKRTVYRVQNGSDDDDERDDSGAETQYKPESESSDDYLFTS
ncbi:hypothetical protein ScPMuIL_001768 [Solemya velum]